MYLEGSISPIKKPQVVILQNWNLKGSVCKWPKPQEVIMQFSHSFFIFLVLILLIQLEWNFSLAYPFRAWEKPQKRAWREIEREQRRFNFVSILWDLGKTILLRTLEMILLLYQSYMLYLMLLYFFFFQFTWKKSRTSKLFKGIYIVVLNYSFKPWFHIWQQN